jgi:hypothetical protein
MQPVRVKEVVELLELVALIELSPDVRLHE